MIEYGPTRHTLRARTLTAAFARVRAFVDGHAEVLRATSGFGGDELATLGEIAEVLAELDESDPMAGLNGYAWTIDVALRGRAGEAPSAKAKGEGRLGLLAHAGRLSLTLELRLDDSADALVQVGEAVRATMGIRLVSAKRGQQALDKEHGGAAREPEQAHQARRGHRTDR